MNNKKVTIHIKSTALFTLLQTHIPDFALTDSYAFVDGSLLFNCRIDKLPQTKEDIFTLLCSETPWGGELSENKQAILDTLEVFECQTVEGFYGDTVADVKGFKTYAGRYRGSVVDDGRRTERKETACCKAEEGNRPGGVGTGIRLGVKERMICQY